LYITPSKCPESKNLLSGLDAILTTKLSVEYRFWEVLDFKIPTFT